MNCPVQESIRGEATLLKLIVDIDFTLEAIWKRGRKQSRRTSSCASGSCVLITSNNNYCEKSNRSKEFRETVQPGDEGIEVEEGAAETRLRLDPGTASSSGQAHGVTSDT